MHIVTEFFSLTRFRATARTARLLRAPRRREAIRLSSSRRSRRSPEWGRREWLQGHRDRTRTRVSDHRCILVSILMIILIIIVHRIHCSSLRNVVLKLRDFIIKVNHSIHMLILYQVVTLTKIGIPVRAATAARLLKRDRGRGRLGSRRRTGSILPSRDNSNLPANSQVSGRSRGCPPCSGRRSGPRRTQGRDCRRGR